MTQQIDVRPVPVVGWPWRERVRVVRTFHTGCARVRDGYGPVAMVTLGPRRLKPPVVMVSSPRGAQDVLGGSDPAVDKIGLVYDEARAWGDNSFTMAHEAWLPRRRTLQPLFTKARVATYAGPMVQAAEELAAGWVARGRVDLEDECRRYTLRVLGRAVLGLDSGERFRALAADFGEVMSYPTRRITSPVRVPRGVPTPARRRFRRSRARIGAMVDEVIAAHRADPDRDAPIVQQLLAARDPDTGAPLTVAAIRAELFNSVQAGHDTTATTLTYALWALGRHRDVQDRVAAEVGALGDRALTVEDLPRLAYTAQVVHEALRLCPPAAVLARHTTRPFVVDGHLVPAGCDVLVGVWAIHRDPALWDAPEEFDPDRFAAARAAGRDRWQFLPFGAGPRSCIGTHFAMLEATLGLATLVSAVEVTSVEPAFPVALPFTMVAGGPIPVDVRPRAGR